MGCRVLSLVFESPSPGNQFVSSLLVCNDQWMDLQPSVFLQFPNSIIAAWGTRMVDNNNELGLVKLRFQSRRYDNE